MAVVGRSNIYLNGALENHKSGCNREVAVVEKGPLVDVPQY